MKKNEEISEGAAGILCKAYARRLVPDETGGYVASIQEFPGCVAEGDTPDAAMKNLDEAAASWVEVALATGYEIREPVLFHGYSGKIALRIPRGLHKQVAELAELEETSINQLLVTAVAQYLGSKRTFREMTESMVSEIRNAISDGVVSLHRNGATLLISFPVTGRPYYNAIAPEGQYITEKLFNLNLMDIPAPRQLGVLQS
ncbi:MAG: toxin-antitoxin system HicB family antitoxin [Sideroxydans sp.]|nr:toxin-antitoxin system HicB family antitoxin [Sideroxydans sp.]